MWQLMKYKVILHEEDGGFWAEVPTLPGCYSQGRTLKEVREHVIEAIQGHVETLQEGSAARIGVGARMEEVAV